MHTRSEVLAISGWSDARFQSLMRRGHIDNLLNGEDWRDVEDKPAAVKGHMNRRRQYSALDILAMIVFDDFTRDGGVSVELASSLAANLRLMMNNEVSRIVAGDPEIWVGAIFYRPEGRGHFCTTAAGVAAMLSSDHDDWPGSRVIMSSATVAAKMAIAEANRHGIDLDWAL